MKSKPLGFIAALLALALASAQPAQAQNKVKTPKIKDSGAVKGKANTLDLDAIFGFWQPRVIQVHPKPGGQGIDDSTYNDLMQLYSSVVRGATKGAQAGIKAGKAKALPKVKPKVLSKDELAKIDVDLPFAFGSKKDVEGYDHIILWDSTGKGGNAAFHEPRWQQQAKVLKRKLKGLGADEKKIHIQAIKKKEDFLAALKAHKGKKKVYIFGHGEPLVIMFGEQSIKLADNAKALQEEKVDMLCHYGCSFVNVGKEDLKAFQDKMKKGYRITLYGHKKVSNKKDDTPWHKNNPIIRCEVSKDCAKLYEPEKEAQARAARQAQNQLNQLSRWGVTVPWASKALDPIAAYNGTKPKKIITPSPWDRYVKIAVKAYRAKGFATKPVPPLKAKPALKRLKKAKPPKSWYQKAWNYVWGEDS